MEESREDLGSSSPLGLSWILDFDETSVNGLHFDQNSLHDCLADSEVPSARGDQNSQHDFIADNELHHDRSEEITQSLKDIIERLDSLGDRLQRLERSHSQSRDKIVGINSGSSQRPNRKRAARRQATHRSADNATASIRVTSAVLFDKKYVWTRPGRRRSAWEKSAGFWTHRGENNEELVEGDYLLAFGSELAIEVRPNYDGLPVTVQWNEKSRLFEGEDEIDGRRLVIGSLDMMSLMAEPDVVRKDGFYVN